MPSYRQRDQLAYNVEQKISATNVAIFVRENSREILFAKFRQHFTGQQDGGMKQADSYWIVNGCRFKESDPAVGPEHPLRFAIEEKTQGLKPYILVRGRLEALVTRALNYELIDLALEACPRDGGLGIWSGGGYFALPPT